MSVKPLILLGTTQCESLRQLILPVVESWAADWLSAMGTPNVDVAPVHRHIGDRGHQGGWKFSDAAGQIEVVCAMEASSRDCLMSRLLCHDDATCQLADGMALSKGLIQAAVADLISRMLPEPQGGVYEMVMEDTVAACGVTDAPSQDHACFHLMLALDGMVVDLWLPIDPFVPRMAAPAPTAVGTVTPLTHPGEVLGNQVLDFEVRLGNSELELGTLSRLKVGDVIRLDKDLQDPLYLMVKKSPVKFGCYLGKHENHLALRIDSLMNGQGQ